MYVFLFRRDHSCFALLLINLRFEIGYFIIKKRISAKPLIPSPLDGKESSWQENGKCTNSQQSVIIIIGVQVLGENRRFRSKTVALSLAARTIW